MIGHREWKLEKFSAIVREEISWIFEGYVARGKITGLSGEPGCGKSLITLDWAARFSSGRGWPDGTKPLQGPGKVLIFATEDDASDTILPRFEAAGGKPDNLLRIRLEGDTGFYFDDPKNLGILRMVTEQHRDIGMVIIDPILEHMRADKEQATREAYAPLRALIAQRGVALLQVAHTNKRAAQNLGSVGDKVGGVKALVGLPRFVYSVHNGEDGLGHLCPVKQNVGKRVTHSMDFRIEETNEQPHLVWTGEGIASASEALTIQAGKVRGGCPEDLKRLLTSEWQESGTISIRVRDRRYKPAYSRMVWALVEQVNDQNERLEKITGRMEQLLRLLINGCATQGNEHTLTGDSRRKRPVRFTSKNGKKAA